MVESLSDFLVPSPAHLYGKRLSIYIFDRIFVGVPAMLESPSYDRNHFYFHVGFVLTLPALGISGDLTQATAYQASAEKVVEVFKNLEREKLFLSNEAEKEAIGGILKTIVEGFRSTGTCRVPIDSANILHFALPKRLNSVHPTQAIKPSDVPVPVGKFEDTLNDESDLIEQRIHHLINGIYHVQLISFMADVDAVLVGRALESMVERGVVQIIDILQYSNVYMPTFQLHRLAEEEVLREACVRAVADTSRTPRAPPISEIFALYCRLRPGLRLGEFCLDNKESLRGIRIRKFVMFGLVNGLIRRVHQYAILAASSERPAVAPEAEVTAPEILAMNGERTLDDLAVKFSRPSRWLDQSAASHPRCLVIIK
eukprot:Plantae.Rhodophyta-Rhodochaete_pulchella.ctg3326.p1 GENE.Plantae.Rhodophyta-Rhodochaete_pulchella.ctg3326~~Plantae.Rhodophyta-Rhodochaete_pulchella.ctg3326.p1  ORF type:complete len:429 (+),score=58.15 Plantae.Rhodophyta-Rhodochaete_pulchella.ctg3326:178-1287(+)